MKWLAVALLAYSLLTSFTAGYILLGYLIGDCRPWQEYWMVLPVLCIGAASVLLCKLVVLNFK